MNDCLICLFSYNRYPHLKLCLDFLIKDIDSLNGRIIIFDDGSSDKRIHDLLYTYMDRYPTQISCNMCTEKPPIKSTDEEALSIGKQRKEAIKLFLMTEHKYVLLLDDDVIVSCATIMDAIEDFDFLERSDYLNPGILTLHGQLEIDGFVVVDSNVFSLMHLTGEAHLLLSRESLIKVGNHFGKGRRGFADTQLEAYFNAGYDYLDRVNPPYSVQHVGFGEKGSVIHAHQKKMPVWNKGPYRSVWKHGKSKPIEVNGFDLGKYCVCVQEHGGMNAPLAYLGEYDG